MAKIVTGRKPLTVYSVSHAKNQTKKTQNLNIFYTLVVYTYKHKGGR